MHHTTAVICACWGIHNNPIEDWCPARGDYDMPGSLEEAIKEGQEIESWNVAFEKSLWQNVLTPQFGWIYPDPEQWVDTMAVAQYYAMPAGLDRCARALNMQPKDPEGGRLISKYSKLNLKTAKKDIPDHEWVEWRDMTKTERDANPGSKEAGGYFNEDLQKFIDYCIHDVRMEQSVSDYLGDLPDREKPVFQLDQKINQRGMYLDISGIDAASDIVTQRAATLTQEFKDLVGLKPSQNAPLLKWFAQQGLDLDNLQADTLKELIDEGDLPACDARRAIEIRLAINKASTKKLDAMARQVCPRTSRAKFQMRYHGAGTGRWTGTGFQPLNLNRGFEDVDPERLVADIGHRDGSWLDSVYGDAMDAVARASRHWIRAAPGHRILAGDYASIEAIVLACLAGEEWKVEAFRSGVKIYEFMADKIYSLPPGTVTKSTHPAERQDGKTGELAFGYQGALGAWLNFDSSGRHSDERIIEICKAWRAEHPQVVDLWATLQAQAIATVITGEPHRYRQIGFEMIDDWLSMEGPSGKRIWYFKPLVRLGRPQWCQPQKHDPCRKGTCGHKQVDKLSYMAQKEGQWKRVHTYGGKLTENACQFVSRELLVPAMLRLEEAGYPIIMSVYDEIVCEVSDGHGSKEEFKALMEGPLPGWAADWPITCDVWEGQRYKK